MNLEWWVPGPSAVLQTTWFLVFFSAVKSWNVSPFDGLLDRAFSVLSVPPFLQEKVKRQDVLKFRSARRSQSLIGTNLHLLKNFFPKISLNKGIKSRKCTFHTSMKQQPHSKPTSTSIIPIYYTTPSFPPKIKLEKHLESELPNHVVQIRHTPRHLFTNTSWRKQKEIWSHTQEVKDQSR